MVIEPYKTVAVKEIESCTDLHQHFQKLKSMKDVYKTGDRTLSWLATIPALLNRTYTVKKHTVVFRWFRDIEFFTITQAYNFVPNRLNSTIAYPSTAQIMVLCLKSREAS